MNTTYIKKSVKGYYVEFPKALDSEIYNIGSTYEDFLDNKWVELTEEQLKFKEDNPHAGVRNVIEMTISENIELTIEQVKAIKINELKIYDSSEKVNSFTVNNTIFAWFTPEERSNYANSINAAKLLNQNNLIFAINDNILQVSTERAELMLASIQLYADNCYMVTKQHEIAINNLSNIEEINNYDFTQGYPNKLNFDLI